MKLVTTVQIKATVWYEADSDSKDAALDAIVKDIMDKPEIGLKDGIEVEGYEFEIIDKIERI